MHHSLLWWLFVLSWLVTGIMVNITRLENQEKLAKLNLKLRISKLETEIEWLDIRNRSLMKGTPPWSK